MSRIRAVLFDLDGTLIPTEMEHLKSYQKIAQQEFGFELDIDTYRKSEAKKDEFHVVNLINSLGGNISDNEAFMKAVYSLYNQRLDNLLLSEGFFDGFGAVKKIKAAGYRTCLVTSSPRSVVDKILVASNSNNLFEYTITGEDILKYKPDPEGYLKALSLLGEGSENCLVVEDTARGLEAARRAGINCVLVSRYATVPRKELLKLGAPVLKDVWKVLSYIEDTN